MKWRLCLNTLFSASTISAVTNSVGADWSFTELSHRLFLMLRACEDILAETAQINTGENITLASSYHLYLCPHPSTPKK
jgi:hypothetical protein